MRLDEIDPRMFFRWVRDLQVERVGGVRIGQKRKKDAHVPDGKPVGPASGAYKRLLRAALQAMLTYAHLETHLDEHVKLGEHLRIEGSTERGQPQVEPLTLAELDKLLDATAFPRHRALFAIGCAEGLRPSELVRVRWEDVSWTEDQETLRVRGDEETSKGKTAGSAVVVPLAPYGVEAQGVVGAVRGAEGGAGLPERGRRQRALRAERLPPGARDGGEAGEDRPAALAVRPAPLVRDHHVGARHRHGHGAP